MTPRQRGVAYRLFGPLVQIVGIILFLTGQQSGERWMGLPVAMWGLILVAVGLAFVVFGLLLSYRKKRTKPAEESDFRLKL